ncbi:POLA2, partial [Symbiodinium sp. CCMP2456]
MWQHARRHIDWLQEDSQARAEAWDRTWGLGRMPRRRGNGPISYAEHAPGIHRRDPYYLARLGPWSRVIRPASPHLDDGIADCGRRVEQRRRALCTGPRPPPSRAGFLGGGAWSAGAAATSAEPGRRRGGQRAGVTPGRVAGSALVVAFGCQGYLATGSQLPALRLVMAAPSSSTAALVDFRTLAAESGAGDVVVRYVGARGLARTATLALVEPNPTRFEATVVDPLLAGFRARTQWEAWSAQMAAAIGAIPPPSPSASALPALSFPTRRLAGADAVLARIYREHTVSKSYTPLLLGEILEAGSLHIVGGSLVAADDKRPWEPRGVMSVLDGLEAVRLAWILTTVRVTADIMADTSSWLEAMATPPRPEPKKPARPQPPPKAEPDQGADWTPPAQKWQRTGKGKKGQKGQKGGKKGNKGAGKGQERQRRQDEQRRDQAWDDLVGVVVLELWLRPTARRGGPSSSSFDGIGASHWLVAKAFGRPLLAVSWEVDRACKALVQKAMPWVEHRGEVTRDSPGNVADLIMDADPDALALIVWCAAPPCQDFSRIGQGEGHQGDRGRLFQDSVKFMHELRARENVDMDQAAAKVISDGLGVQPVFACPSDFGWVSRPRLWWTSVDWTRFQVDPDDGAALEWAEKGRWERLRLASARPSAVEAMLQDSQGVLRPALEPALSTLIDLRHDLCRIRREVIAELLVLVEEREDDTRALPGANLGLLRDLGYPATADLEEDLRLGFDMLGPVRRESALRRGQVFQGARRRSHSSPLGGAGARGGRLGPVTGPCAAPDHWSVATSALPWTADMRTLRQPPLGDCFAALSFAICQVDENGDLKLRRGEDWRRPGHNATMSAEDVPTHHFLGDIVDFILAAWCEGWDPKVFGHDLQNAYRQWAVRCPGHCGT